MAGAFCSVQDEQVAGGGRGDSHDFFEETTGSGRAVELPGDTPCADQFAGRRELGDVISVEAWSPDDVSDINIAFGGTRGIVDRDEHRGYKRTRFPFFNTSPARHGANLEFFGAVHNTPTPRPNEFAGSGELIDTPVPTVCYVQIVGSMIDSHTTTT